MTDGKIVAVGLLTQPELDLLGHSFTRLWPVEQAPHFDDLIEAIDRADREMANKNRGAADS